MDTEAIERIVGRHFRVYERRQESIDPTTRAELFYVMFQADLFDPLYDAVRAEIRAIDPELLVFMRRQGGEDILFVAPRPHGPPETTRMNLILLIATVLTTTSAGAVFWEGFANPGAEWRWSLFIDTSNLLWGFLTFALPLMLILGIHESAHFVAARKHGLRASLPYFIPVPPVLFFPIGTFGAFIRLKDPLPDRKALFDVGASGPIAGFIVAVPLLVLGAAMTSHAAVELPDLDRPDIEAGHFMLGDVDEGLSEWTWTAPDVGTFPFRLQSPDDGWEVTITAIAVGGGPNGTDLEHRQSLQLDADQWHAGTIEVPPGTTAATLRFEWDDHLIEFGDPLLVKGLNLIVEPGDYLTHPTYFAAWVGILITGINLLPAGQLDGGHVARAVLGDRVRIAGMLSLALLMFLAFQFSSWLLLAVFLVFTGLHHPPPLNDRTQLDPRRRVIAAMVLVIFVITFVPVPIVV